jgi:hypothetical protein
MIFVALCWQNLFYKATLFDRVPKFAISDNDTGYQVTVMPLAGFSLKPAFRNEDWSNDDFAGYLALFWEVPYEAIRRGSRIWTTLETLPHSEAPSYIDIRQHPWRGVP